MNDDDLLRYNRQIILPQFGIESQQKLTASKVLIIGIGGLGSPAALYLSGVGIGEITLVDFDKIELSNLSRQIIYNTQDIDKPKVIVAKQKLTELNPSIIIKTIDKKLTKKELSEVVKKMTIVLDCTDNFKTRYLINQVCFQNKIPLVSAAAIQFSGQLSSFNFNKNQRPCYQCLYPETETETETTCAENGILSSIVGTMGLLQSLETIKILTGIGETLDSKLLIFDGLNMSFKTLNIPTNADCPICHP